MPSASSSPASLGSSHSSTLAAAACASLTTFSLYRRRPLSFLSSICRAGGSGWQAGGGLRELLAAGRVHGKSRGGWVAAKCAGLQAGLLAALSVSAASAHPAGGHLGPTAELGRPSHVPIAALVPLAGWRAYSTIHGGWRDCSKEASGFWVPCRLRQCAMSLHV